jgi:hypothetical protein
MLANKGVCRATAEGRPIATPRRRRTDGCTLRAQKLNGLGDAGDDMVAGPDDACAPAWALVSAQRPFVHFRGRWVAGEPSQSIKKASKRSRNALTAAGSLARYCGCCFVVVMMAGGLRLWLRLRERASECGVRGICLRTAVQRRTMLRWAVDARLLSLPQNSERMRYEGVLLWHSSRWGACRK